MNNYITSKINYNSQLPENIISYLYEIINKNIEDFGLTLANPIRNDFGVMEFDISLSDDADTIGNCITKIIDQAEAYLSPLESDA